eukprot:3957927-Pleurochrysis_carterae.AAC.1
MAPPGWRERAQQHALQYASIGLRRSSPAHARRCMNARPLAQTCASARTHEDTRASASVRPFAHRKFQVASRIASSACFFMVARTACCKVSASSSARSRTLKRQPMRRCVCA